MSKILLVEHSDDSQNIIRKTFQNQHEIVHASTAEEACAIIEEQLFDFILLDLNLPTRDGHWLLEQFQQNPRVHSVPVICLTKRASIADKITAFSLGVEDYILKPFEPLDLRARVDARLKKSIRIRTSEDVLKIGNLKLCRNTHTAKIADQIEALPLTPTEFKLLLHFSKQPERVFSREQLLMAGWGNDFEVFDRAVDVHVCSLRKKMGELSCYIQSVPGVGYKLSVERTVKKSSSKKPMKVAA